MRHLRKGLEPASWLRLIGVALLVIILMRSDLGSLLRVAEGADLRLIGLAVGANFLLILVKTSRLQMILRPHGVRYNLKRAYLAYWSSIYIGLLTPGRLGEFVKVAYVTRDCSLSSGEAFSSVLADRLFDLYALLLVGSAALLTWSLRAVHLWLLIGIILLLTLPLVLFLHSSSFTILQRLGLKLGQLGEKIFAEGAWLFEMRNGLRQLSWSWILGATGLTVVAYTLFFAQCYMLALALGLQLGFFEVTYAAAIGSLVTLLPISISGLGTREAAIIAYLGGMGITPEMALGFSLLLFANFHVVGGLIGAVAWWIRPVPLREPLTKLPNS